MQAVFWTAVFLYVRLVIHPELSCQLREPAFFFEIGFLSGFLRVPGGLTLLVSAFLSQFLLIPWLGSALVTVFAAAVFFMTRKIGAALLRGTVSEAVSWIPAVLLIAMHQRYDHSPALDIGLVASLLFLLLFLKAESAGIRIRWLLFTSLCGFLFFTVGILSVWFAALCILTEVLIRRRIPDGFLYIAASAALFGIWRWTFFRTGEGFPFDSVFSSAATAAMPLATVLLFLFFPTLTAAAALLHSPLTRNRMLHGPVVRRIGRVVFAAAAALLLWRTQDPWTKTLLQTDRAARQARWAEVIRLSCGSDHMLSVVQRNQALFHRGCLLDSMFCYPGGGGTGDLIPSYRRACQMPLRNSDLWLDLGHVNEALHWAHEAFAVAGDTPWNHQRLAELYFLKHNPNAAGISLSMLDRTLFFRKWAGAFRARMNIAPDSVPSAATGVGGGIRRDFIVNSTVPERDLEEIVLQDPGNRMALEYLVGCHLLTGRLDRLTDDLGRLRSPETYRLPRHLEEALILRIALDPTARTQAQEFRFDAGNVRRFRDFQQLLARYSKGDEAARPGLEARFGDTYWYYYLFIKTAESASSHPSGASPDAWDHFQ
jgi:hypothetical protein